MSILDSICLFKRGESLLKSISVVVAAQIDHYDFNVYFTHVNPCFSMTKAIWHGFASLIGTLHLSSYENILTIALISIHYSYNNSRRCPITYEWICIFIYSCTLKNIRLRKRNCNDLVETRICVYLRLPIINMTPLLSVCFLLKI